MKIRTTLKQRTPQLRSGGFDFVFPQGEEVPAPLLAGRHLLVTGGDSAMGRAVALACAREGADVALAFQHEDRAAGEVRQEIEALGRRCVLIGGQMDDPQFCRNLVGQAVRQLGGLHVLINNLVSESAVQGRGDRTPAASPALHTDVFSMFYVTRAAIPHLGAGAAIINTAALLSDRWGGLRPQAMPPAGEAIAAYTRSLAQGLAGKKIRVNAVAFDPTARPASLPTSPLVAPCYVFLASGDSSEITGRVICPEAEPLTFNP